MPWGIFLPDPSPPERREWTLKRWRDKWGVHQKTVDGPELGMDEEVEVVEKAQAEKIVWKLGEQYREALAQAEAARRERDEAEQAARFEKVAAKDAERLAAQAIELRAERDAARGLLRQALDRRDKGLPIGWWNQVRAALQPKDS